MNGKTGHSHHAPYQSGTGEYGIWDAKRRFEGVTKETMVLREPVQAVQSTQLAVKHATTGECEVTVRLRYCE